MNREGARSIWYQVSKYGRRGAEVRAKRHLKRPETRRAMWQRLTKQDDEDPVEEKPRKRFRGKQSASLEGRVGPDHQQDESDTSNSTMGLIDLFGGVSSLRVALAASGYDVVFHHYVDINGASAKVVKHWFPDAVHKVDV